MIIIVCPTYLHFVITLLYCLIQKIKLTFKILIWGVVSESGFVRREQVNVDNCNWFLSHPYNAQEITCVVVVSFLHVLIQ